MDYSPFFVDVYGIVEEGGEKKLVCWSLYTRMFLQKIDLLPEPVQRLFADEELAKRKSYLHDEPLTLVTLATVVRGTLVISEWIGEAELDAEEGIKLEAALIMESTLEPEAW